MTGSAPDEAVIASDSDDSGNDAADSAVAAPADVEGRRAHDRARLRWPLRVLIVGTVLSFGLAFLGSYGANDGALGLMMFLLLMTLVLGVAALLLGSQLLLDEMKGRPTSLRRGLLATGLFVGTFVMLVALNGVATSVGAG